MLSFVWTYLLPSTGLALLAALLWSQRRVRRLTVDLETTTHHFQEVGYRLSVTLDELARMRGAVEEWKYSATEAAKRVNEAQSAAAEAQARFELLRAKIMDAPVPDDADGAIAWMADMAKSLAAEVGR